MCQASQVGGQEARPLAEGAAGREGTVGGGPAEALCCDRVSPQDPNTGVRSVALRCGKDSHQRAPMCARGDEIRGRETLLRATDVHRVPSSVSAPAAFSGGGSGVPGGSPNLSQLLPRGEERMVIRRRTSDTLVASDRTPS